MTTPEPAHTLPEHPNLEHLKKQAKRLLSAYRQGDAGAVAGVTRFERNPDPACFALADAQRVLARSYGFASWTKLKEYLITGAIKRGDSRSLRALIAESKNPQAVLSEKVDGRHTAHASFGKGVTLLQLASFWENEAVAETLLNLGAILDFHSACGLGNLEAVARILKSDPSVIDTQVDTYYPLQFAITAGQPEALRYLLEHGDDANRPIKKVCWFVWEDEAVAAGQTSWKPIHMATLYSGQIAVAECLRDFGADLDSVSPLDGYRSIHLAAMSGKMDVLGFLVSSGVDIDSRTSALATTHAVELEDFSPLGGHGWTPLMVAAGEGHLAIAEQLLKLGAKPDACNSMGQTPLHFAAGAFWDDKPEIVQLLINHGADRVAVDSNGRLPIDYAREKGYERAAQRLNSSSTTTNQDDELFLELFDQGDRYGAKTLLKRQPALAKHSNYKAHPLLRKFVNRNDGHCYKETHLTIADLLIPTIVRSFRDVVLEDRVDDVREQLRAVPELVSAEFTAGRGIAQAIHHWRSIAVGELLLDAGADIHAVTTVHGVGETPLAMQLRFGTVAGVRFLLEKGADPNRSQGGHMPSDSMAQRIELLLDHGWNIDNGQMLHDANHGHGARVITWLKYGADPNVANTHGQTALHLLAAKGSGRRAIRALVKAGADMNACDHDGNTPLDLARSADRKTAEQELISLGANQ